MLAVEAVRKSYGKVRAVRGVSFRVARGEILAILGPNGAGKTTLVSLIAGLLYPDAGAIKIDGTDCRARPRALADRIGLAPQELAIYPILTVEENLRFFSELSGVSRKDVPGRIEAVAHVMRIHDLLRRTAGTLSGGEKRRLHTAIALVHEPELLLLDEPTAGVDVATRMHLLEAVRALADAGAAICYSTHYLHEVEELGASVVILDRGEIVARGTVASLISRHGASAVDLSFDGPVPRPKLGSREVRNGNQIRITARDPTAALAKALARLGSYRETLSSVDVVKPSLESVFFKLTGRAFDEGGSEP